MRTRILVVGRVLVLALGLAGCGSSGSPATPLTPSPQPTASPAPTAPAPIGNNVLSGVVFEVTSTGRTPLEGVTVYLLTCGAWNCPNAVTADFSVQTDRDGLYRIDGVYPGNLNFLWVRDERYDLVNPMAPGTCPDGCDRVVMVSGDTRLDIELVRR
jgi:hypothetical protein